MENEYQGTIKAKENFDAEDAAKKFKKAMKGMGSDENMIIKLLVSHSSLQRQEIEEKYAGLYGQNLIEDLKAELGGHFEDTVVALLVAPNDLLVKSINDAFAGIGTDEKTLIDIFCCRTADEIESLRRFYEKKYNRSMDDDFNNELSGPFKRLMRGLITCQRDDDDVTDAANARKDAQSLYDAGVGEHDDSDTSEFISILNNRSFAQLKQIFHEYDEIAGAPIEDAIKDEFKGDMRNALMALVQRVRDPLAFYAERLFKSMDGRGTDDKTLIRILVSRSEIDLADIRSKYKEMYKEDLVEHIKGDTSGDYGKLLVSIVGK